MATASWSTEGLVVLKDDLVSVKLTRAQVSMLSYCTAYTLGVLSSGEGSKFLDEQERGTMRQVMMLALAADDQFRGIKRRFKVTREDLARAARMDGSIPEKEKRRARRAATKSRAA